MKRINKLLFIFFTLLYFNICAQSSVVPFSNKQVTIELLLVEYIHRDGFNWGFDIFDGQKGKFSSGSYEPGNESVNLSFIYDVTGSLSDR